MEKSNNKQAEVNVRRTFISKILGALMAAVLLPKLSGLFASTKKWTSVSPNNKVSGIYDALIGEIGIFGFNFPPSNWAFSSGQLISIPSNTALYSILGTTYGGNGQNNFALPDLRGRFPMGAGHEPGLSDRVIGELGGEENVTLVPTEMPVHIHTIQCNINVGNSPDPANRYFALEPLGTAHYGSPNGSAALLGMSGDNNGHNNMHPYLALNFCICLNGNFPSRP